MTAPCSTRSSRSTVLLLAAALCCHCRLQYDVLLPMLLPAAARRLTRRRRRRRRRRRQVKMKGGAADKWLAAESPELDQKHVHQFESKRKARKQQKRQAAAGEESNASIKLEGGSSGAESPRKRQKTGKSPRPAGATGAHVPLPCPAVLICRPPRCLPVERRRCLPVESLAAL